MRERDRGLLQDILEHGQEAIDYLDGVALKAYMSDRRLRLATERLLEIVGEAAGALSDQTKTEIDADWRRIRGLRNMLAHQYGAVDPARFYAVVKDRLPDLLAVVRDALGA